MEEQKGFFGLLDKYLMGPMSVIAQLRLYVLLQQLVWQQYHLRLLDQCFWYFLFCHKHSHSGLL